MVSPRMIRLLFALALVASAGVAQAQSTDRFIPYKGTLERDGHPYTGRVNMTFELWDDLASGNRVYQQTMSNVSVTGGNFSVQIGSVPESVINRASLYLAILIDGVQLTGRQLVQASPWALRGRPGIPFRADSFVLDPRSGSGDLAVRAGATSFGARALEVAANSVVLTNDGGQSAQLTPGARGGQPSVTANGDVIASHDLVAQGGDVVLSAGNLVSPRLGVRELLPAGTSFPLGNNTIDALLSDAGGTVIFFATADVVCAPGSASLAALTFDVLVGGTSIASSVVTCTAAAGVSPAQPIFAVLPRATFPAPAATSPTNRTITLRVRLGSGMSLFPQRASLTAIILPAS